MDELLLLLFSIFIGFMQFLLGILVANEFACKSIQDCVQNILLKCSSDPHWMAFRVEKGVAAWRKNDHFSTVLV